jgi:hypothetical protein
MEATGGGGGKAEPTGGTAGASAGGAPGTGGATATGGSAGGNTGGSPGNTGGAPGQDASAGAGPGPDAAPMSSGGDPWAKCGPEAFKADVTAAEVCARYISVCKASVSMDACVSMYNGLSDGPRRCRACVAYYTCLASTAEVMAMSCLYVSQGLGKGGPCKPSYCD